MKAPFKLDPILVQEVSQKNAPEAGFASLDDGEQERYQRQRTTSRRVGFHRLSGVSTTRAQISFTIQNMPKNTLFTDR